MIEVFVLVLIEFYQVLYEDGDEQEHEEGLPAVVDGEHEAPGGSMGATLKSLVTFEEQNAEAPKTPNSNSRSGSRENYELYLSCTYQELGE